MKRFAAVVLTVMLAGGVLFAGEQQEAGDWQNEIYRSLQNTITVNLQDKALSDVLSLIARQSGVSVVLDDALPQEVRSMKVSVEAKEETLQMLLGRVLARAELRFTLKDGGIYVSTVDNLVKAMLKADEKKDIPAAAEPFTTADAVKELRREGEPWVSDYRGGKRVLHTGGLRTGDAVPDLSNPYEAMGFEPWRAPQKPYVDPRTGVTHFPAPPVWVAAENEDDPRYLFTTQPSFLKAEYLWKKVYAEGSREAEEHELLGRLTEVLEDEDDLTQKEVLKQLIMFLRKQAE